MAKIEFERIERACPYNTSLRAKGDSRGILYDFNVMVDGEHRAIIRRKAYSVGYDLKDADNRPIHDVYQNGDRSRGAMTLSSQATFRPIIIEMLNNGRIPTLAAMADWREAEAAEAARRKANEIEAERISTIQRAAVDLYDALKAVAIHFNPVDATTAAIQQQVYAAIAKAEDVPRGDDDV